MIMKAADQDLLAKELLRCTFLKNTRYGNNEIYLFDYRVSKHLMLEVGRLRELTFREAGGGTGKEADIDGYDIGDIPYQQLIVWDPRARAIIGGYRFLDCTQVKCNSTGFLSSSGLFLYSKAFRKKYLPCSIELGRSWIQPEYQCRPGNKKGIFSLENLWEGMGLVIAARPAVKYLFGKVTIPSTFHLESRDLLIAFMEHYFPDPEKLVKPVQRLAGTHGHACEFFRGLNYADGYRLLKKMLGECGEHIPPLVNAYMRLSRTMRTFGSTVNAGLGNVVDTGLLITVEDIAEEKQERYLAGRKGLDRAA
jgi:hypothetical protein